MSWINWYYGVRDQNWLLRRIFEEDHILNETWLRLHTSREAAEDIPPDYDELLDEPGPILLTEYEQDIMNILKQKQAAKSSPVKKGRPQKLRIPIPKKIKVNLIRERGGLCERCKENAFHHFHHIDGDPSNNSPFNLLLVCYECHMELEKSK